MDNLVIIAMWTDAAIIPQLYQMTNMLRGYYSKSESRIAVKGKMSVLVGNKKDAENYELLMAELKKQTKD